MRPYRIFLTLFMTLCLISLTVNASAFFDNYPEDTVPGWQTPSPYQRNIYFDFFSDHSSVSPGPIPVAVYEGYLDSELWGTDYFYYTGLTLESGSIGIADGGSGVIYIYLNNLESSNPVKRIYMEATVKVSNPFAAEDWIEADYRLPDGHDVVDDGYGFKIIDFFAGEFLLWGWVEIQQNPAWEEAMVILDVPADESAWIHDIHFATKCAAPDNCESDFDFDGDVDGQELARLAASDIEVGLDAFGPEFGESGCLL